MSKRKVVSYNSRIVDTEYIHTKNMKALISSAIRYCSYDKMLFDFSLKLQIIDIIIPYHLVILLTSLVIVMVLAENLNASIR